jgi:hypothetical protein
MNSDSSQPLLDSIFTAETIMPTGKSIDQMDKASGWHLYYPAARLGVKNGRMRQCCKIVLRLGSPTRRTHRAPIVENAAAATAPPAASDGFTGGILQYAATVNLELLHRSHHGYCINNHMKQVVQL